MNAFDILEELGNLDDQTLLGSQSDLPGRKARYFRNFRNLAAACLTVVLLFTALIATDVIALEPGLQWKIQYDEQEIVWQFKDGKEFKGRFPVYAPAWLPEEYQIIYGYRGANLSQTLRYYKPSFNTSDVNKEWIDFNYAYISDRSSYHLQAFWEGTYHSRSVEIGGLPGEMYTYIEKPDCGELIWVDKDAYVVFHVVFQYCETDAVMRLAESVRRIS